MNYHRIAALLLGALVLCGSISAEVPPEKKLPCFPGAYYRKAVSSVDTWSGIEGVVTLPQFTPDPSRLNPDTGRPLDNPSIYMGGRAGDQEIDAGVTWEVIKEPDGSTSKLGKAFRPFWRNKDWHSGPANPDFYYYPGDQIRIRIESLQENKLTMFIELLNRGDAARKGMQSATEPVKTGDVTSAAAADAKSTATAKNLPTPIAEKKMVATGSLPTSGTRTFGKDFAATSPDAVTSLSVTFDAPNFGPDRLQQFKRVNAIDQTGNEGKPAQPTKARVTDATWTEVNLLRGRMSVPMSIARFTDMRCPAAGNFTVFQFNDSAERISIWGSADKR